MNIAQIKHDLDNGVIVSPITWRKLVQWAMEVEEARSVPIERWQDRMGKSGKRECADLAVDLAQAEIDELRAAWAVGKENGDE